MSDVKKAASFSAAFAAALCLSAAAPGLAKTTATVAAKLGKTLTPVGAEKAGNAAGTIPAWTGGITKAPAGYKPGSLHKDPFSADKVQSTITGQNYTQVQASLTPGQIALFKTFPQTFKMHVYPTRRSASYPQSIYQATRNNATSADLIEDGKGIKNAAAGVPFPIPQNGLEVIWNHLTRYRGETARRKVWQASPAISGTYSLIGLNENYRFSYNASSATVQQIAETNILFKYKQNVITPARLAGTALLIHEPVDHAASARQAWTYNKCQRRVRRAPNVAYDAPATASDGLMTTDDADMYNGSPERFSWSLKGKKEILVPYNSYKLHNAEVDAVLKAGHVAPGLARYERHRVWVVEAALKPGLRHIYSKRRFYIDEDSWQILLSESYNAEGKIYRVGMAHVINYYDLPAIWSTLDVIYDINSRRYIARGLNDGQVIEFNKSMKDNDFTANALRRASRR